MKKILLFTLLIINLCAASAQQYRFYAVSNAGGNQTPVYLCELDSASGAISIIENYSGVVKGSYFALSLDQKQLLVTSVNSAQNQGGLVQYNISGDGRLTFSRSQFNPGGIPCYVSFTPDMNYTLSAYYGDDKISICNFTNEEITAETDKIVKADNSKGHCILTDPSGKYVYAVFLGLDKVFCYTIEDGDFVANTTQEYFSLPDGFGPRHLVFHPDSSWVYILNESNSSVTAGSYNPETGAITEIQNISMLPSDFDDQSSAAAIRIHPNGRFLYASNRGHNSIAVYEIADDGILSIIEYETSGINTPRDFNISEDGKFMLVGNQKGNSIFSFRINELSGELDYTGNELAMSSPTAMVFLPFLFPGRKGK
jgi:6-phosphogluconolactonase